MRKCRKCSRQYDDSVRICRNCGSFLESVAASSVENEETSATPPVMDESPLVVTPTREEVEESSKTPPDIDEPRPLSSKRSWRCRQCQQPVPNTFDVCWNCGASRDETPDLDFVKAPLDNPHDEAQEAPATQETARRPRFHCPKCGSSKVIPKASMLTHGPHDVHVAIYGDPEALFFTDPFYGTLTADICGACGHVELRVQDPKDLYRHYRRASKRK